MPTKKNEQAEPETQALITISPTENKLELNQGDTITETITVTIPPQRRRIKTVKLVSSGGTTPFVTSITPVDGYGPLAADKEHSLKFEVTFTGVVRCKDAPQVFQGTLDVVVDDEKVARKLVEIRVPACRAELLFSYSVKFVCGIQPDCSCACAPVRPGTYATEINISNPHGREVPIRKLVVPVVFAGAAVGREPRSAGPRAEDKLTLPAHSATMDDCCRLAELLLGAAPTSPMPLTIGFLQIISPVELSVTAVYTASGLSGGSVSIDVQQIASRRIQ
jgi:hypothetical protein